MKSSKFKFLTALVLSLALVLTLFTGCSSKTEAPADDSEEDTQITDTAEPYTVAVVVKLTGIAYFNRLEEGVKQAAADLGVDAYVTGPTQEDSAEQIRIIEDLISQGVDAIVVVPTDADALVSVLNKARDAGIVVISNESPGQEGVDYDIELVDNQKYAEAAAEDFAQAVGGSGTYAQFVGSLTQPLHNTWADYVEAYFAENYPDISVVTDRLGVGESADDARTTTLELLKTYPDLKGVISFGSQGPIGAAEAAIEENIAGDFVILGCLMPSEGLSYLESGAILEGLLWDPLDSGYATVAVAKTLLDGGSVTDGSEIAYLGAPTLSSDGVTLAFDKTLWITADNAADLGF